MRFKKNLEVLKAVVSGVDFKEYSGFGGLHKVMSQSDHESLKNTVGEDGYKQIMATSKTAYYTSPDIIKFMYKALAGFGFKGGKVLEPSCGHGSFIFNMPNDIRNNSAIHAVELDPISAKLTSAICPYAHVNNTGFEKYNESEFDLIIGNPPYSNMIMYDKDPELNNQVIHHYFMAKSLKMLKEGGILAFVVPTYCLDNTRSHARDVLSKYGRLLASYRLPENMFDNAKVTVDVVFIMKTQNPAIGYDFLNVLDVECRGKKFPINEYYHHQPKNVIGYFDTCRMYEGRIGLTVKNSKSKAEMFAALDIKIQNLEKVIVTKSKDTQLLIKIQNIKAKLQSRIQGESLQSKIAEIEYSKLKLIEQEYKSFELEISNILKGF